MAAVSQVAHDFLQLFEATGWLLEHEPSVWCVSAWNDNGYHSNFVASSPDRPAALKRLLRTGYFPGLGWMIRKEVCSTPLGLGTIG